MTEYLINTSFHADKSIADDARKTVVATLTAMAAKSGLFRDPLATDILTEIDPEMSSFAVQFKASDLDEAMRWITDGDGGKFLAMIGRKHNNKIAFFTTPMRIID